MLFASSGIIASLGPSPYHNLGINFEVIRINEINDNDLNDNDLNNNDLNNNIFNEIKKYI